MNRAFVSLYLIIALSILLLGAMLNKFWDEINPPLAIDSTVVDLLNVLEQSLQTQAQNRQAALENLSAKHHFKASLISLSDFSKTSLVEEIKRGDVVAASDSHTNYFYKRIHDSDEVLMLSYATELSRHSELYVLFIVVFYGAIAVVIFLWVWPLTRDLSRLTQHAQQMGGESQQTSIAISSRSILYPFAKVFNSMAKRLDDILRSQKEMTLAVSHELRTPLARMKFALAMTEDQHLSPSLLRQMSSIKRDIAEMEALINSFLAYAAFDPQSQQLNQREGHIQDLVQEVVGRLTNHIEGNIEVEIADKTNGLVMKCEWSLMQTAIQNLIHNALDYAKSKIRVGLEIQDDDFIISVEDDGPGIAKEDQERVFEAFVRIYSDIPNRTGFGLGLALVRRIMDWHSGVAICGRSQLGGAAFTLKWAR
ncbi:ATP-binding protein [Cellvibrio sp.]|uniref:ATP-binding protein n=1 Tax=Cellvibrio sp. TaxID=1965322 RepID=UPI0039647D89